MLRFVWFWVFLGFLGHATGALAAVTPDTCEKVCPDESSNGEAPPQHHCPPTCDDCMCGGPLAVELPIFMVMAPDWSTIAPVPDDPPSFAPDALPTPDPREILHIPR